MRGPSRQTMSRLVTGALTRAATARARSQTMSPCAPSTTDASVSGHPGFNNSAGDRAMLATPLHVELPQPLEQCRIEGRRDIGLAGNPCQQISIRHIDEPFELGQFAIGE